MTVLPDISHGYKALTHTYAPPWQGGPPLCNGQTFPVMLPTVTLDTSEQECAAGWNYCANIHDVLQSVGLWPDGYPSRVFAVEASGETIQRGSKRRTSCLTLVRECQEEEIAEGITALSQAFAPHTQRMVIEQLAWRAALRRPRWNRQIVEESLQKAVALRDLSWTVQEYATLDTACTTPAAWEAWDARAARDAWDARAARAARAAWVPWAARDAWAARNARTARAMWNAWDAQAALTHFFATLQHWMSGNPLKYTLGIRDAYVYGLAMAMPAGDHALGWTMVQQPQETALPDRLLL